jgi:hypothetical protein
MSLHAELSPEALQRLHIQRRNSTISSIVIAMLVIVLICLVLAVVFLPTLVKETPTIITYEANLKEESQMERPTVQTNQQQRPSSPSQAVSKVIVSQTTSPTAVPVPDVDVTTPAVDFGDTNDFSTGWGDTGTSDGFANIPTVMKKRCSKEDRLQRLQETGGTPECEDAVVKALRWMKSQQNSDGSWTGKHQPAMTGLSLLAYLGHCETPLSEEFGDSCLRAITYLTNLGMTNGGKLTTNPSDKVWPYEHAIATYALAEAATFCKQGNINVPNLFEVTQKAGQWIIDNQHDRTGGWDYSYDKQGPRGGDLSITAWHVQALKACHHTGLEFKGLTRAANKAIRYVTSMSCRDGGFAYEKVNENPHAPGNYRTMTGGGVLCLQMWDKGALSNARSGAKYIEDNTKFEYNSIHADLYGHYYEAQAMMNRGGEQWKKYNAIFRDQVLNNQNSDGSWKAPNGGNPKGMRAVTAENLTDNLHYRTCLNTLMLEVYYRFLPGTGAAAH